MLENTFLYWLLISRINVASSYGYKDGCKEQIHSLFPSPRFTLQCWSRDQIFMLLLTRHLDRNPIDCGKCATHRWAACIIAKIGKGKQPSPVSLLNQAETEARSSASKSFPVTGVLGSCSTAEPKRKGVWGNVEDRSSSETHGRMWSSDVVSYDILWRRNQRRLRINCFYSIPLQPPSPICPEKPPDRDDALALESLEGQNESKLAMSGHLLCFLPVNHFFLSCECPLSVRKQHQFFCGKTAKKVPRLKPTDLQRGKEEESARRNRRTCWLLDSYF